MQSPLAQAKSLWLQVTGSKLRGTNRHKRHKFWTSVENKRTSPWLAVGPAFRTLTHQMRCYPYSYSYIHILQISLLEKSFGTFGKLGAFRKKKESEWLDGLSHSEPITLLLQPVNRVGNSPRLSTGVRYKLHLPRCFHLTYTKVSEESRKVLFFSILLTHNRVKIELHRLQQPHCILHCLCLPFSVASCLCHNQTLAAVTISFSWKHADFIPKCSDLKNLSDPAPLQR